MEDIFGDLFKNLGFGSSSSGTRTSSRREDGSDLLYRMSITFEEAVNGAKRDIKVDTEDECSECHGPVSYTHLFTNNIKEGLINEKKFKKVY